MEALARRRWLMRASLWAEQLGVALAPGAAALGAFACAVLLGLFDALPFGAHLAVLAAAVGGVAFLLRRGLRTIVRPTGWAVDRALEARGGVAHQPLLALADAPSGGDGALWAAHQARQRAAADKVRPAWPRPLLAAADPRALRAIVALAVIACVVVAGDEGPARLSRAVWPVRPAAPPVPVPAAQAWLTPPAYTGQPPAVLAASDRAFAALSGTRLVVTVTATPGAAPTLIWPGGSSQAAALNAGSWQAAAALTADGVVAVTQGSAKIAAWTATIAQPQPPDVIWAEPPGPAPQDEADTAPPIRLPWEVHDSYGVTALHAELTLRDRPDLPALKVPLTLPSSAPRAAHGVATPDLTAHPFAGLPVVARLVAENGVPLSSRSEAAAFTLPERAFRNPAARALIAARRMLTLRPEDRRGPAEEVFAVGQGPDHPHDAASLLELGAIPSLLMADKSADAVAQAQTRLWALALKLEDATQQTAEALAEAEREAKAALTEAQKNPSDAAQAGLDKKLAELRQALDAHVQALDERRTNDGQTDSGTKQMEREAQRDAAAAADAAKQRQLPKTQDKLAELDKALQALRNQEPRDPDRAEAARKQAGRKKGQQQLNVVQDMVQRQTTMVDQADRRGRGPARTGPDAGAPPPERQARDAAERQGDSRVQQALRRALGELLQQSGDLTGEVPKGLTDADQAMREAATAMDHGADPAARAAGERAVASLQEGSRELANKLKEKFGKGSKPGDQAGDQPGDQGKGSQPGEDGDGAGGQGDDDMALDGDGEGEGQDGQAPGGKSADGTGRGDKRDPFGRALTDGGHGMDDDGNVRVPTEMERLRARDLRGELRRRDADQTRPPAERGYIERLLEGTE